jgi:hypothetical protein
MLNVNRDDIQLNHVIKTAEYKEIFGNNRKETTFAMCFS